MAGAGAEKQPGAEKQLYDAARNGDLTTFKKLLQTNQHLLDVVSFSCLKNVLHIAIKQGRESIVGEVLEINPELALDLDSKNSSSLHLAAAKGNVEITKRLLSIAPEMCWWRDCHDMNPIHIAAMKGNEEVLNEMLQLNYFPAMERLHRGQTVLHLCVKHGQLETLKVLVEHLGDLAYAKDDDGETLLHLAVRSKEVEIVRYLVKCKKLEELPTNSRGKTALHILHENFRDTSTYSEMKRILGSLFYQSIAESLPKMSDTAMVVVVLIATMAFQAAVSPPGGVWQEDTSSHSAGKSVMATTHPNIYKHFIRANNTAFISSILTILLITTGGPQTDVFIWAAAAYSMWVSIAAIGVSYGASLIMTNPMETKSVGHIVGIVAIVISAFAIVVVLRFLTSPIHALLLRNQIIVQRFIQGLRIDPVYSLRGSQV